MKTLGFRIILSIFCLTTLHAETLSSSSFHDLLLSVQSKVQALSLQNRLPLKYRDYMSFYSQDSHSEFISLRDSWINLLKMMPESLSSEEQSILADFSNNKFLQQLSLDEITYYSFVYEAWSKAECLSTVRPFLKGASRVFGVREAPFALSSNSSVLSAIYLSFKPSAKIFSKSIHSCLNLAGEETLVPFLQIGGGLSLMDSNSKQYSVTVGSELLQGTYKTMYKDTLTGEEKSLDIEVFNNSVSTNLMNYNICFTRSPGLEDRCYNAFGKTCSSRRN